MAKVFLGIVDGTGPYNDGDYAVAMASSFCRQLYQANKANALYLRGPSGEGMFIERRAHAIADAAMKQADADIILAGYSRGGSIAVIAAEYLKAKGRKVGGLLLFDPVARHFSASSDMIPSNVAKAWVARRMIGAPEMDKYDDLRQADMAGYNPVRNWFGTTATQIETKNTKVDARLFLGSHGALGGVGWRRVKEDLDCQMKVASFMNEALATLGLRESLRSLGTFS